jgi:hypothetical protein
MVVTVAADNPRTGERLARRVEKKVPGSMTLLALERRAELPDAILKVPEVRAALEAGSIRVVEQAAVAVPAPVPPAVPAAPAPLPCARPSRPAAFAS